MKFIGRIQLVAFLIMGSPLFMCAQDGYRSIIKEAWDLYQEGQYQESAVRYEEAFDLLDGKAYPNDRYNAACSFALARDTAKAFYHLTYLADHPKVKYRNLSHISTDSDLVALHGDARWIELLKTIEANKMEYEKDLDMPLVKQLDSIYQLDQSYRREIRAIEEQYGRASKEMQNHWKLIQRTDSINLIAVRKILDERGWLSPKVIGKQGNSTLFLVIQHADLETQQQYLPMMREAVALGNASASSLALLEDRVALREGKRQIYGSQIGRDPDTGEFYVSPLVEPEKVNERRAEMGLGPIEDYIQNWDMTWDVEQHKANTRKIESANQD